MRVTDLEKFALEHIWRPYQTLAGFEEGRLLSLPMSLDETARKLGEPTEWSDLVLNRIRAIGISLPSYIQCELADVLRFKATPRI